MLTEKEYKKIEAFLGNSMTLEEVRNFEKELTKNSELKKELDLYDQLNMFLSSDEVSSDFKESPRLIKIRDFLRTKEASVIDKMLRNSEKTFLEQKSKTPWYKIAAIIFISISLGGLYIWNKAPNIEGQLFNEFYDKEEIPSFNTRGNDNEVSNSVDAAFRKGFYEKSILLFKDYKNVETAIDTNLFLVVGASYIELNKNNEARKAFEIVGNSETLNKEMGQWFLALTYLNTNELENCIALLNVIANNKAHFKQKEAKEILKKLKS